MREIEKGGVGVWLTRGRSVIYMNKRVAIQGVVKISLMILLGVAGIFMVAGCTSGQTSSSDTNEGAIGAATVEGTIVSVFEDELLIEAENDSAGGLSGLVRVGVTEIDKTLVDSLSVGDSIVVEYPGFAGMSEPPFISATSIQLI